MKKFFVFKAAKFALCAMLLGALTACTSSPAANGDTDDTAPSDIAQTSITATGSQTVVADVFDWGPGVTKTILTLDQAIDSASVSEGAFTVKEIKLAFNFLTAEISTVETERSVVAAYTCDEKGSSVTTPSKNIALEMNCTPTEGYPIYADSWQGRFGEDYTLHIALSEQAALMTETGASVEALNISETIDWSMALIPALDNVVLDQHFAASNGVSYGYASYSPSSDEQKHPLVIWLHGAGEGGTDTRLPMIGNKAVALCGEEFQSLMGGAYVLAPQCPDFWLTYNENGDWQENPGLDSIHLSAVMELIRHYVEENPNIDTERIYLAGCSNGGFMTMDIVLNYPDYFAAAVPCCEAFLDEGITDDMLTAIKDLPIWFVYANSDPLVVPELYEIPTIERLKNMNASNLHTSVFEEIVDLSGQYLKEDGTPYDYGGHSCWVHFFNNDCVDENGLNVWEWLAEQHK